MSSPLLVITPIYAVILSLMLLGLSFQVIKMRQLHRVLFHDGGVKELRRAVRGHGNFVEYVPIFLLLMALCELNDGSPLALHGVGATLVLGRLVHAYSVFHTLLKHRVFGMSCTFLALIGATALLISTLFGV